MDGQVQNPLNNGTQNVDPAIASGLQKPLDDKVGNIDNPLLQGNEPNPTNPNQGEERPSINQFGLPIDGGSGDGQQQENNDNQNTNPNDNPLNDNGEQKQANPLLDEVLNQVGKQDGIDEMLEGLGIEGTKFGGVDLVDFQDFLDFETPEGRQEVLDEVKRLKGYGYSDEQIKEYTVNSIEQYHEGYKAAMAEMQGQGDNGADTMTPAEIKANLEANLSRVEIMNIPTLLNWVKANINSDLLTNDLLNGMFTDPTSIKVLNALYTGSMRNSGIKTQEPKMTNSVQNKMQIQPVQAMQFYQDWLSKQGSVTKEQTLEQINKLRGMINEQALGDFDELFKVLK